VFTSKTGESCLSHSGLLNKCVHLGDYKQINWLIILYVTASILTCPNVLQLRTAVIMLHVNNRVQCDTTPYCGYDVTCEQYGNLILAGSWIIA